MPQIDKRDGFQLGKGESLHRTMVNNETSALDKGTLVKLDTGDDTGTGIKLPAAEASPDVYGVTAEIIGASEEGAVCIEGPCMVRADGTEDITAGDDLSVYDTNGVAQKHSNHLSCSFGHALEGYTSDDSNGYIKAYFRRR